MSATTHTNDTASTRSTVQAVLDPLGGPVARWIFALPFVAFGLLHLANPESMAAYVPSWIPGGGVFWVVVTGIGLIAGGAALTARRFVVPAALGLATMVLGFVLTIHLPGLFDEATRGYAQVAMLKDLALVGGALLVVGLERSRGREAS